MDLLQLCLITHFALGINEISSHKMYYGIRTPIINELTWNCNVDVSVFDRDEFWDDHENTSGGIGEGSVGQQEVVLVPKLGVSATQYFEEFIQRVQSLKIFLKLDPWVMKEGESKEGSFHFDAKLSIW